MYQLEQYWHFALLCLFVAVVVLRLILRERITLQGSLAYLMFLFVMGLLAVFPRGSSWLARQMGFSLPSNLLFALAIGALAILHLSALMTLARVELRSIALTQELGLIREKLDALRAERVAPAERPRPKSE